MTSEAQVNATKRYEEKQKRNEMIRVSGWVPKDQRARVLKYFRRVRKETEK